MGQAQAAEPAQHSQVTMRAEHGRDLRAVLSLLQDERISARDCHGAERLGIQGFCSHTVPVARECLSLRHAFLAIMAAARPVAPAWWSRGRRGACEAGR
jgi:hypothetical protein